MVMEWEVGQLPSDPQIYSIYGADHLYLYYYYPTTYFYLGDHQSSNSPCWDNCDVLLDDKENLQKPAVAMVAKKLQLPASSKADGVQLEELQRYFDRPITEAARELRVGLTLLKKRCRALGIARWPHRKIKSINSLIRNLKHLGQPNWDEVRPMLEEQRRMVEAQPHIQLSRQAKKIRQKCFKALYYANATIANKTCNRTMAVTKLK